MKNIYWRPHGVSRLALILIAVVAATGLLMVEANPVRKEQPFFKEKVRAARLTAEAFEAIKEQRRRIGLAIDKEVDPMESGLIGTLMSTVTSNTGSLSAKQTSINPNFAALVVHLLLRAEVVEGDVVAVGLSGSFPAINAAVCTAIETLKLKPIVITSASASSWGANEPKYLWIDMEKTLHERKIISFRTIAASIGGVEDDGLGMTPLGLRQLRRAIDRHGIPFIDPEDYTDSLNQRMAIYREQAGAASIKAYVNVGGGTTSVGTKIGKRLFKPGLNRRLPLQGSVHGFGHVPHDRRGRPGHPPGANRGICEALRVSDPAAEDAPHRRGRIFYSEEYNKNLATGVLVLVLVLLYAFIRSDWGFRMLVSSKPSKGKKHPGPMV
ncbi:MAG: poly-gamma-glutamate system protein [Deltaproteobacteria bacterium]|nr:poly-gamma-glutamate system protein [Deltaproteobacteria bacterium]